MLGKTTILKKIHDSPALKLIALQYYKEHTPPEKAAATVQFFELLHSSSDSLPAIREMKYEQMVYLIVQTSTLLFHHEHQEQPTTMN